MEELLLGADVIQRKKGPECDVMMKAWLLIPAIATARASRGGAVGFFDVKGSNQGGKTNAKEKRDALVRVVGSYSALDI